MENQINLYFSNGKSYVWNSEDILHLRKEHRIIGSLVGCYPVKPFQIQTKWLPLQLLAEETKLLLDKGIAQLVQSSSKLTTPELIDAFYKYRDKLCERQVILLKENRKQQILSKADEIYEGKRKKHLQSLEKMKVPKTQDTSTPNPSQLAQECIALEEAQKSDSIEKTEDQAQDDSVECKEPGSQPCLDSENMEFDKQTVIEAELAKLTDVDKELCMVQLFTESIWKTLAPSTTPVPSWTFPSSEMEQIRYAVFKDLWEKKYYITSGTKFGGDFLAYEGDPMKYHALFIVVCKSTRESFQANDLVVYGRLGHQVKKTVTLASLAADKTVEYLSLSWEHEIT